MMYLIMFAVWNFINVVLQTMRSILTIKASNQIAAIANAVCYGVYVIVLKQLQGVDMTLSIIVTVVANYTGVLFSVWLLNRFKHDTIWIIDALGTEEVIRAIECEFQSLNIHSSILTTNNSNTYAIRIYSQNQKNSICIGKILKNHHIVYGVTQTNGRL